MSYKATIRAMEAAQRRQQRDSQRRLRELERQTKEQAKLSAIEQARLEVETYEGQLEVLVSVHKEQGEVWDWTSLAAALPPPSLQRNARHEQKAKQRATVLPAHQREGSQALIEQARLQDEQEFQQATQAYSEQMTEWEKLRILARRILAGENKAYTEALVEFNPFAEISDLGSAIHFTAHNTKLAECVLKVNGKQAIPAEVKTLTASGKVSIKPMPKGRFHEIYQDYVCGCVLRVTREIFALLPVEALLVTASVDLLDPRTGQMIGQPVLSVFMPRAIVARLDFDRLDASDAMENFKHRGDFKASRKSEAFQPIIPLTPADIVQDSIHDMGLVNLNGLAFRDARILPAYLDSRLAELKWAVVVQELKLRAREEQRRIQEQMREDEKVRREQERAIKDAQEKEEAIKSALEKARQEAEHSSAQERAKFDARIAELSRRLAEAEAVKQREISMAQLTRAGNVYIISNIGSFGEEVFKIGMTRRREPMDRIWELGDASVPFEFDVHAMIYSEDAPALERMLHNAFDDLRINKVNYRKEFFRLPLERIKSLVADKGLNAAFTLVAEAHEYRETKALEKMTPEEREKYHLRRANGEDAVAELSF